MCGTGYSLGVESWGRGPIVQLGAFVLRSTQAVGCLGVWYRDCMVSRLSSIEVVCYRGCLVLRWSGLGSGCTGVGRAGHRATTLDCCSRV
jgi:hypothetical protein